MRQISISEKIIFYFVVLGVIVIVIIGNYTFYFAKKALINRTFDQLISLRLEKKNRIEQFFFDRVCDINLASKSEEIRKIINLLDSTNYSETKINNLNYNSYLKMYINSYGYYQQLHVINTSGKSYKINYSQNDSSTINNNDSVASANLKDFCKKIKISQKTIIQDLSNSKLLIYIGTPIFNQNTIIGFLVLEIPINAINNIMFGYNENNGLGKSGETYLVGSDSLMRSNSRFKENAVFNLKVNSEAVKNAFDNKTDIDIVKDYRNVLCLSSYSKINIEGLNWVIIAEIDQKEAMIPVYHIRNSILLISVIIALSVFIFAFFVSNKIAFPIKKLQKASEELSAGNYDVNLKIYSLDEIGLLTETFNNMSLQLKKQKQEIENEKNKRANSLIDGQEMERQRLSRDLHDSLGQSILAVKIKLEQAKNSNPEKNQQIINETQELLKNAINEIRTISNNLMPAVLTSFGMEQGLKNLCKNTFTTSGIKIDFRSTDIPNNLDKRFQIFLYRISQEVINNIVKHSNADLVDFEILFSQNHIFLNIIDNGKGFDPENIDIKGNGIINIKQRVELLKGEFKLISNLQKGTQIKIKIPILENDKN